MRAVRHRRRSDQRWRGFTLVEMLVGLGLFSVILLGILTTFDFSSKFARAQTEITGMQQALRAGQYDLARLIRMAGRGPIPLRAVPNKAVPRGLAVEVENNVAQNTQIGITDGVGPMVVEGTDILTIRGVFTSSLYQINHLEATNFTRTATGGTVTIANQSPTGVRHDLAPILDAICDTDDHPEALVLVSPLDDAIYAVVQLDPATSRSNVDCSSFSNNNTVLLNFLTNGANSADYLRLSPNGAFPAALTSVAFLGILEEYRFYIREDFAVAGDTSSEFIPHFSMARVFPGSDMPYRNDILNWQNDIADNMVDLQVAMGLDVDNDGDIEGTTPAADDEWLYNHSGDNDTQAGWNSVTPVPTSGPRSTRLYYLRVTTLARTSAPDVKYQAPVLTAIEDHAYTSSDRLNSQAERRYRRRQIRTLIDMRNIT